MKLFSEYEAEKAAIELSRGEIDRWADGTEWRYEKVCQAHRLPRCPQENDLDDNCVLWAVQIYDETGESVGYLGSHYEFLFRR